MIKTKQFLVYVEFGGDMECWELCNGYYQIISVPKDSPDEMVVREWVRANGFDWDKIDYHEPTKCYTSWGRTIRIIELKESFENNKRQYLQWV